MTHESSTMQPRPTPIITVDGRELSPVEVAIYGATFAAFLYEQGVDEPPGDAEDMPLARAAKAAAENAVRWHREVTEP